VRVERDLLIEKLIERLQDETAVIRRNAAGALRLHGRRAQAAIPVLERLLDDPSPMVRAEARRALERLANGTKVA
jgi:HEAT repeat protein